MRQHRSMLVVATLAFAAGLAIGVRGPVRDDAAWAQDGEPPACQAGDVNSDGEVDISDPVHLLRFLFLDGPAPAGCPAPGEPMSAVLVVRHAEKGDGVDPGLTEVGQARAEHLAQVLRSLPVDHLIASDLRRTQETLAPTAALFSDLELEIIGDEAPEEVARRVLELEPGSVTVVAHHSYTIHSILEGLGLEDVRDIPVGGTHHDNLLLVLLPRGAPARLLRLHY